MTATDYGHADSSQIGRADDTKKIAAHRRRAAQEDCRGQRADVDTSMCQSLTKVLAIPARRINLQLVDKTKKAPPRFFETQYRWSVDSMVRRLGRMKHQLLKVLLN